ncbi:carboxypeptidase regulatory-like domain-containing protein [Candidatus Poribacteria bacterium]|nr:carboxypeptidase regulatory-like domain-containing protein [Candidatus Poribacteria bacterium]
MALMILLGVSISYSQDGLGVIQGKLTDVQTGELVGNHKLTLHIHKAGVTTQQETTTNSNGEYRFENLTIDFQTHYTITTNYNGFDYEEKNIALSSFVPNVPVNIDFMDFTDDQSAIRIKSYTIVLGRAPDDHPDDGALSIMEAIDVENSVDKLFLDTHGTEKVGIYLPLPDGYEGFAPLPRAPESLTLDANTDHAILTKPLPAGRTQIGFTYIIHGKETTLDLSRSLSFHTDEISIFVPEGINLVPNPKLFTPVDRQPIHGAIFTIYSASSRLGFPPGKDVDLSLEIVVPGSEVRQESNVGQLIFIAIAAALAGGFLAAAIFTLRAAKNRPVETDTSQGIQHEGGQHDAGWLRKLNEADLEFARMTRLEIITRLDDLHENEEISDRVYNRLRKEQTDRLTEILDINKDQGKDQ